MARFRRKVMVVDAVLLAEEVTLGGKRFPRGWWVLNCGPGVLVGMSMMEFLATYEPLDAEAEALLNDLEARGVIERRSSD